MKKITSQDFLATPKTKLEQLNTYEDLQLSNKELKKELRSIRKQLGAFQNTLYAHGKYSVLICLQGMDTAGKDSLVREVFKDFNARGVEVHSFKVPTEIERQHDYLWRHYIALPARGRFGVFNRTHYENVLVTRVHPEYILGELLPDINDISDINPAFWEKRFRQINDFERHLHENGTIILKFFLHLSKEEQRQRLLRRLRLPQKNWKFSPDDLKERKLWNAYQECYQDALQKTSKPHAPWFVIPADNKRAARVIVAGLMWEILSKYTDIKEPELSEKIRVHLDEYRNQLNTENE